MSATRPNPFAQVFYDRGIRLAAGLAVVVAIPMAVLFYFQFKSLNDIETTSAVVLRQLSSETADSLIPTRSEISWTQSGPRARASTMRTRVGSPRIRKVSARAWTKASSRRRDGADVCIYEQ